MKCIIWAFLFISPSLLIAQKAEDNIDEEPKNVPYLKAQLDKESNKFYAAILNYDFYIELYQKEANLHYGYLNRGECYMNLQVYKQAIIDFNIVISNYKTSKNVDKAILLIKESALKLFEEVELLKSKGQLNEANEKSKWLFENSPQIVKDFIKKYFEEKENILQELKFVKTRNGCKVYCDECQDLSINWDGNCIDGYASGIGRQIIYNNDSSVFSDFKGNLKKGRMEGSGEILFPSNNEYNKFIGEFKDDLMYNGVYYNYEGKIYSKIINGIETISEWAIQENKLDSVNLKSKLDNLSIDLILKKYESDFDISISREKQEKIKEIQGSINDYFKKWNQDEQTRYLTTTFLEINSEEYFFDLWMGYIGYKKTLTEKVIKNNKNYVVFTYLKSNSDNKNISAIPSVQIRYLDLIGVVYKADTPKGLYQEYLFDQMVFDNLNPDEIKSIIDTFKINKYKNELDNKSIDNYHFTKKVRDSIEFNSDKTKILKNSFEAFLFTKDRMLVIGKLD